MPHSIPCRRLAPRVLAVLLPCAALLSGPSTVHAQPAPGPGVSTDEELRDRFSYAVPSEARVTHVALDLRVDFDARVLSGTARLSVARHQGARLVLDTNGLEIAAVTDGAGRPLDFDLRPAEPIKGRALLVTLGSAATGATDTVVVRYRTTPDAAALQWLTPAQTAGRAHPFLFSQGQAILTRSWIPTQDSPGLRQTYEARLLVPPGLRAVMSAEHLTPDGEPADGGVAFRFRLTQPVAPYLFALAVGDIARREIGPRTAVFAEPATVEAAAREFVDLEKMLSAAETLYGPYRWGRYDVLVLPPAFPYGGMENPRLTFLTPTLLAGDRSLVAVVAHELAHSWSGNLVTNATWRDFWLNEGFTTYFELRIMEALYGARRAAMNEALERDGMHAEIDQLGPTSPATQLYLPDTGDDPDANMSDLAYSKGSAFLRMLERELGRARLDAYLTGYFSRYAFTAMTTPAFLRDVRHHLLGNDAALERRLHVHTWLFEPGLPPNLPPVRAPSFERAAAEAARFAREGRPDRVKPSTWATQDWVKFLTAIPRDVDRSRLAELDRAFHLSDRTNSEVLFAWLVLAVAREYDAAVPALERFLTGQGRRRFVEPLYQALVASDWGRPIARRIYGTARAAYHPVTVASLDRLFENAPR